jgi:hypothetical protein
LRSAATLSVGACIIYAGAAHAGTVSVEHSGADRIGRLLAHELSLEIARNSGLVIGTREDEGWRVVLLTVPGDQSAVYSAVLVKKNFDQEFDFFVTTVAGACSAWELRACAYRIVTSFVEPISEYESGWREDQATAVIVDPPPDPAGNE